MKLTAQLTGAVKTTIIDAQGRIAYAHTVENASVEIDLDVIAEALPEIMAKLAVIERRAKHLMRDATQD